MKHKFILAIVCFLACSLNIYGVHYGHTQEFYKAYQGPYYEGLPEEYHIVYTGFENRYFKGGNKVAHGYFSSLQEAIQFANARPEITHFYYVGPRGIYDVEGMDYASDSVLVHEAGYTEFFAGKGGILYPATGTHIYYKQSVVRRPENYVRYDLITYLKNNPEAPRQDDTYFEMPVTLEQAYEIVDNDPSITHFMILQYDNQFSSINLSKDNIVFFQGALPSWLNETYRGRIYILEKTPHQSAGN